MSKYNNQIWNVPEYTDFWGIQMFYYKNIQHLITRHIGDYILMSN